MRNTLVRCACFALAAWMLAAQAGQPTAEQLEAELEAKLAERRRRAISLAQLYSASGDWRKAAEHFESARRIRDDDVQVLTQLTRLYATHRDHRKLLSPLQALVRLQPTSVGWLRELGSCYYRLGEREKAEAAWSKILEAVPNRPSALRVLAQAYATHGLHHKAIATWRQAVEASPRDEYLRLQLAEALSKADEHLEALATIAALRTTPASSRSRRARSVANTAYFKLDLPRPVRAAIEKLLHGDARPPADFAWAIAQAFEQAGDPKRAADFHRQVAELEPKTERGKAAAAKTKQLSPKP